MDELQGLYTNTGETLSKLLEARDDSYAAALGDVGNALAKTNKDLLAAGAAERNSDPLRKLAIKYGVIEENYKGQVTNESVVMAIKDDHDQRSRVLAMISNVMDSADRALRAIIDKIGR